MINNWRLRCTEPPRGSCEPGTSAVNDLRGSHACIAYLMHYQKDIIISFKTHLNNFIILNL